MNLSNIRKNLRLKRLNRNIGFCVLNPATIRSVSEIPQILPVVSETSYTHMPPRRRSIIINSESITVFRRYFTSRNIRGELIHNWDDEEMQWLWNSQRELGIFTIDDDELNETEASMFSDFIKPPHDSELLCDNEPEGMFAFLEASVNEMWEDEGFVAFLSDASSVRLTNEAMLSLESSYFSGGRAINFLNMLIETNRNWILNIGRDIRNFLKSNIKTLY